MTHYYAYDTNSTVNVSEPAQIQNAQITLRHIPKPNSITIANFTETTSLSPATGQFFCDYSPDTQFRDSNRLVHFNPADNGKSLTVQYIAIGTVFTADDANEIKAHMENSSIHGGGSNLQIGDGFTINDSYVRDGFLQLNDPGLALQDGKLNSNAFYRLKHTDGLIGENDINNNFDFSPGDVYADFNGSDPTFFIKEGGSLRNLNLPSVRVCDWYSSNDTHYIGDIYWSNNHGGGYVLKVDSSTEIPIQVPYQDYQTVLKNSVLPIADKYSRGAIRPGTGLSMDGDVLNCTLSAEPVKKFNRTQVVNVQNDHQIPQGSEEDITDFYLDNVDGGGDCALFLPNTFINPYDTTGHLYYNVRLTHTNGKDIPIRPYDEIQWDYTNGEAYWNIAGHTNVLWLHLPVDEVNAIVVHYTTDKDGNIYDYEPPTPTFTASRSAFPTDPNVATFCYRYDLNQLFLFDGLNWLAI